MKVFDLGCTAGHGFEGWFASDDAYADQHKRGLLECPYCGSTDVTKRLSAPRLNLNRPGVPESTVGSVPPSPEAAATLAVLQDAWTKAVRHVLEHTEDVGARFAEEARRIHYGETPERGIRGQASAQERQALREEGIEVLPLPVPKGLDGPIQ